MILAFSGYARSGKDTAASVLVEEGGWKRLAFADVLRECVLALNPFVLSNDSVVPQDWDAQHLQNVINVWGWDGYKKSPFSDDIRRLLQRMGTEVGRNILGENIWVDATLNKMEEGQNYVITDCRFPNEAKAVEDRGGRVMRINRLGVGPINDHPSETSLDDWKFFGIITNHDDEETFKQKIRRLYL